MRHLWKISSNKSESAGIDTGHTPYHFFKDSESIVNEPAEIYGESLGYSDTDPLFGFLEYTQADVAEVLEVDPSTLFRWKKDDKKLTKLLTKSILDMDKVIAKGIRIFGSEDLLSQWLHTPNLALGNKKPVALLKNPYGTSLVDQALEGMSWGAVL